MSAHVAIMMFILTPTGVLFFLPFFKKFSKSEITNLIIKRSMWVVATYLMVLNSAIAATIAADAGLDLTREMFQYMWMFGTLGYVLMGWLVLSTLFEVLKLWKKNATNKRLGVINIDE